jgi:hypothetical protein
MLKSEKLRRNLAQKPKIDFSQKLEKMWVFGKMRKTEII